MINFKKATVAALAALLLAPAAFAGPIQDKALDKEGRPILDERGNCVLTKWEANSDICGAQRAAAPAPVKRERLTVAREERTVYFDFNKSTIKGAEKAKLDSLISAIRGSKEVTDVDIVGFADKIGTGSYNQKLSQKRAESVRDYLMANGGVKTRKIDLQARGENEPVTNCSDGLPREEKIACLAKDRRVEIQLNYAQ